MKILYSLLIIAIICIIEFSIRAYKASSKKDKGSYNLNMLGLLISGAIFDGIVLIIFLLTK